MKSHDFEYDGVRLSDKGFSICMFDSEGINSVSNGSEITFDMVKTISGMKHELVCSGYDDYLTATFQICKNQCLYGVNESDSNISIEELRDMMRWLNRKSFHKFKLLDSEYSRVYFEASFNVKKVEFNGRIVGLELDMVTNRPFALQELVEFVINNDEPNKTISFFSKSDEEGSLYPYMEITIDEDSDGGDLEIYSITERRTMKILNCEPGEVINIDYPIIRTSSKTHKIHNDFNWVFYRIATSFKNRENELTISLPCSVKILYAPIIKIGV